MVSWDSRVEHTVSYKSEQFYTVTPLPFYIKRRKVLLELLKPYILNANNVCDLGCGDGWYISYFQNLLRQRKFFVGIDASESMLKRARFLNPTAQFYHSSMGIPDHLTFDVIYTVAMLAHITDNQAKLILDTVVSSLNDGGYYIFFEQVAPIRHEGDSYIRRTVEEYLEFLNPYNSLEIEKIILVRFKFHQLFERFFAKYYYAIFCAGQTDYQRRMNANAHAFFRLMSEITLLFDKKVLWNDYTGKWGNIFVVVRKKTIKG